MKKNLKKILIYLLILLNTLFVSAPVANAQFTGMTIDPTGSFDIGTGDVNGFAVSAFNSILGDMGMNKSSLKSSVKTFNVTERKVPAPGVTISFSPANPVEGEKVTATAMVSGVMNDYNSLYYTWYLKNEKCTDKINDEDDYEYEESCDLDGDNGDGDGEVDIEDYKVKAARIIASNDFDYTSVNYYSKADDNDEDGYEAPNGGADQVGKNGSKCYVHDFKRGIDWPYEDCFHLFPNTKHSSNFDSSDVPSDADVLGDGKFGKAEEEFWHTNPYAKDTMNSGNPDEANALGLARNDFTFTYTNGDKLGVVVEGISTQPTGGYDTAFRTMWAFLDNKCEFDPCNKKHLDCGLGDDYENCVNGALVEQCIADDDAPDQKDTEDDTTNDNTPLGKVLFNMNKECVANNFIDPLTGGGATTKLDVELAYSPQNPINDISDDKDGDEVVLSADVLNATNKDYVNYEWTVYTGKEVAGDQDAWEALTMDQLDGVTRTSGLNMKDFKFKMNFPDGTLEKYLKVKVTAKEDLGLDPPHPREGHADVVIQVNSSDDRLSVYTALPSYAGKSGGVPSLYAPTEKDGDSAERCLNDDGKPKGICEVVKDEIIAVKIKNESIEYSDFHWTVNGKPYECIGREYFAGCEDEDGDDKDNEQTNITYIPILGTVGDTFTVNLSGTNIDGEKFNLTRVFLIADPTVTILCEDADACKGKLLGNYIDIKLKPWEDRSDSSFYALTGTVDDKIILTPEFSDAFTLEYKNKFEWEVDGTVINLENATDHGFEISAENALTLIPKKYGEIYSITFSGLYIPGRGTIDVLNYWWGVTYDEFYEKSIEKSLRIEMVDNLVEIAGASPINNKSKKVFATVATGVPAYFAFLFRIFLAGAVIILALKIIFFVILKREKHEF